MTTTPPATGASDATPAPTDGTTKKARVAGLVVSALAVLFLLFDSLIHIANTQMVREAMADLGFAENLNRVIGVVLLVCLILYIVPATSILGAVLLTGYLGGAVATNMLTEQPIVSTTLFPIYVGVFVWGGMYLRDPLVRSIMPVRRS